MKLDRRRREELGLKKLGRGTDKPPADAGIAALEQTLGATLPGDYRAFLARHGGWSIDAMFDVDSRCTSGRVQSIERFYGLDGGKAETELLSTREAYADRLSPGLLPI